MKIFPPAGAEKSMHKKVVFHHIMKTGGTSLTRYLEKFYPEEERHSTNLYADNDFAGNIYLDQSLLTNSVC